MGRKFHRTEAAEMLQGNERVIYLMITTTEIMRLLQKSGWIRDLEWRKILGRQARIMYQTILPTTYVNSAWESCIVHKRLVATRMLTKQKGAKKIQKCQFFKAALRNKISLQLKRSISLQSKKVILQTGRPLINCSSSYKMRWTKA